MLKFTRIAAIVLLALAVLLALIALVVGRRAAEARAPASPPTHSAAEVPQERVVEASGRLMAGSPIELSQVRISVRPHSPAGAYRDTANVVGLVPTQDIAEGAALQQEFLAQGFSLQVRPGERALAVPVDELAAAGNRILPGDFVDVFLNLKGSQAYGEPEQAQTRLLLSRLRVLSYGAHDLHVPRTQPAGTDEPLQEADGDSRAADIRGSASADSGSRPPEQPARSAVLAVPVAEANRLLLGAQQGKLFLALRNPADTAVADPSLFPVPRTVLAAARGLQDERAAAVSNPENDAFAGLDSDALAGRSGPRPAAAAAASAVATTRRPVPRQVPAGIEIIRGSSTP